MKKLAGLILIIAGIILGIPAALRIMQLAGLLVQTLFDPGSIHRSFSLLFYSTTFILVIGVVGCMSYGRKLWNWKEKMNDSTGNIDSSTDES